MNLTELRDALRQAKGPDRRLDELLYGMIVNPGYKEPLPDVGGWPLRYTASLDAAVTLVPQGWAWSLAEMRGLPEDRRWRAWLNDHNTPDGKAYRWREGNAYTPPLALCLARIEYEIAKAKVPA